MPAPAGTGTLLQNSAPSPYTATIDANGNGTITVPATALTAGTWGLSVAFAPSDPSTWGPSQSAGVSEVVNPPASPQGTVTTITSIAPNPAQLPNDQVVINFTVAPAS